MRFMHISDLHLGKRLREYSLIEDQKYILDRILDAADEQKPQAVVIAGDIYDKPVPPAEAVALFDNFLYSLSVRGTAVFVISGNHDSAERVSFGGRIMDKANIYLSHVYDGNIAPVRLHDEHGDVCFWLLPFVRPANVRPYCDDEINTYTDAVAAAVSRMDINTEERNVLVAHQFVTDSERSDSETSVGGLDNVDAYVFEKFDYTAIGHIHKPQFAGKNIRYCGTPLKYSLSEASHQKSVTIVDMGRKGETEIRTVPLKPLHDLREIRGRYDELMLKDNYVGTAVDDYIYAVLTDETEIVNGVQKMRTVYPNIMELRYENSRSRAAVGGHAAKRGKTENELFGELFEKVNGRPMTPEQEKTVEDLFSEIKGENL